MGIQAFTPPGGNTQASLERMMFLKCPVLMLESNHE